MEKYKKQAFTLVELIIVITILAILSVIALISFQNYTKDSRDAYRTASLKNIQRGLELYFIKLGKYISPDDAFATWYINNNTSFSLISVWEIGNQISQIIQLNTLPKDPSTQDTYKYGVSYDGKYYEIASISENLQSNHFINTTYANNIKSQVQWNYPRYLKFQSGSELWIANIPSLIFNNVGFVSLFSTGTYYIVNNWENLPYKFLEWNHQSIPSDQLIKKLTQSDTAILTGISLRSIETIEDYYETFTGVLFASFNILSRNLNNSEERNELNKYLQKIVLENSEIWKLWEVEIQTDCVITFDETTLFDGSCHFWS